MVLRLDDDDRHVGAGHGSDGQYSAGVVWQPLTMPRLARSSSKSAVKDPAGTSSKTEARRRRRNPNGFGFAFRMNTAICARVIEALAQKLPIPQPVVIWRRRIFSICV